MRLAPLAALALVFATRTASAHDGSHPPDPNLHVDPSVHDCEVRFAPELSQRAFRQFTREFGSVSAFKQMGGPSTLGRWGIAAGVEYMTFAVEEHADAWNDTFTHPEATHELGSRLSYPKLKVRVGVAESTDVGAFFTMNTSSNYGFVGIDVKHALLRQRDGLPVSVSVRGAYTKTLFVGDMDMHALTADAAVGRTLWNVVTPYVGGGSELVLARETTSAVDLRTELVPVPHAFGGLEVAFWHVAVGAEVQYSVIPSAQLQIAGTF
jgi:opacity protein-like surface antigen